MISPKTATLIESQIDRWISEDVDDEFQRDEEERLDLVLGLFERIETVPGNKSFRDSIAFIHERLKQRRKNLHA